MKSRSFLAVAGACLLQCLVAVRTHGAELEVLSAVGMRQVLLDLVPRFERATGHTIRVTYDASGAIVKRIDAGDTADIVMITHTGVEQLTASGKVLSSSVVDLATSVAGVAVRKGAPKPDISTPNAFKRALLDAKSVARPDPALGGASGVHIAKILECLGIADEINAKSVIATRPGEARAMPGYLVADGLADIALHQIQELLAVPGIEIVGPFPEELQERFTFSAGIAATAKQTIAAKEFIGFLRTPQSKTIIEAKGMYPARE